MAHSSENFTTSREDAATRLGVSTRTLDRWLKSGRLRHRIVGRQVFVSEQHLAELVAPPVPKNPPVESSRSSPTAAGISADQRATAEESSENNRVLFAATPAAAEEKIFRELYTETAAELKAKQEKLEAASFRVGQLEAQLKNSIPLLEYKQREDSLLTENATLKNSITTERVKTWIFFGGFLVTGVAAIVLAVLLAG